MIVIVGAGLAGLSAAFKLTQGNCDDFMIIEAQKVLGGRVQSVLLSDGGRVDLGAQWLHGERQNPIYDWLVQMDCIDGPEDDEFEFEGLFVKSNGERPPAEVVSRVLEILLDTKNHLYQYASLAGNQCRPVDIFRAGVEQLIPDCPILRAAPKQLINAVVRWFELYECIDNSCDSLEDLSIKAYSGWADFDDGKMVKLKAGWTGVVDKLVTLIGCNKIRTNTVVQRIELGDGSGAVVYLDNREIIKCDHVILTTPLGALKESITCHASSLLPDLDAQRVTLIQRMGFGAVNKIFLHFSEPYLGEEQHGIKLLTSDLEHKPAKWLSGVLSFDRVDSAPNALLVWVGGEGAKEIERIAPDELGEHLMELLRVCLPEKPPPRLISITRSSWAGNRYIGGAYSYPSLISVDQDTTHLWDPLCDRESIPRILFAGEATAGNMYATAHGAIVSGWREADRLLKRIQS